MNDHAETILMRKKLESLQKKVDMMEELLDECCEYLESEADMVQEEDGEDVPNRALYILSHIIDEGYYR